MQHRRDPQSRGTLGDPNSVWTLLAILIIAGVALLVYHAPATRRLANAIPVWAALVGFALWVAAVAVMFFSSVLERRRRLRHPGYAMAALAIFFVLGLPFIFLLNRRLPYPVRLALLAVLLGSWAWDGVRKVRRRHTTTRREGE